MKESGNGDEALRRLAEEAEQDEAERLARHIGGQAMSDISPTLQAEQNWQRIRWGTPDDQPTIEFDSAEVARLCEIERQREIIDRELTGDVEAEKARILAERQLPEFGVPFGQPPYYGD